MDVFMPQDEALSILSNPWVMVGTKSNAKMRVKNGQNIMKLILVIDYAPFCISIDMT
jgi:hypothetical protein